MAKKPPRKQQIGRSPAEIAEHKKSFVEQLTKGFSPGVAARMVGIARRTAFYWKKADKEFAELWDALAVVASTFAVATSFPSKPPALNAMGGLRYGRCHGKPAAAYGLITSGSRSPGRENRVALR